MQRYYALRELLGMPEVHMYLFFPLMKRYFIDICLNWDLRLFIMFHLVSHILDIWHLYLSQLTSIHRDNMSFYLFIYSYTYAILIYVFRCAICTCKLCANIYTQQKSQSVHIYIHIYIYIYVYIHILHVRVYFQRRFPFHTMNMTSDDPFH